MGAHAGGPPFQDKGSVCHFITATVLGEQGALEVQGWPDTEDEFIENFVDGDGVIQSSLAKALEGLEVNGVKHEGAVPRNKREVIRLLIDLVTKK